MRFHLSANALVHKIKEEELLLNADRDSHSKVKPKFLLKDRKNFQNLQIFKTLIGLTLKLFEVHLCNKKFLAFL